MPSPAVNSHKLFEFLKVAFRNTVDCQCQDCSDALSSRDQVLLQLNSIIPSGQGCPYRRGGRELLGMFLKREKSMDHRLVTQPLIKLVDILRQCDDPTTSSAVWALCQHFLYDGSPVAGTHYLGLDWFSYEHGRLKWAGSPLSNDISKARRADIKELSRLGQDVIIERYHEIPMTRLDLALWDWESQN